MLVRSKSFLIISLFVRKYFVCENYKIILNTIRCRKFSKYSTAACWLLIFFDFYVACIFYDVFNKIVIIKNMWFKLWFNSKIVSHFSFRFFIFDVTKIKLMIDSSLFLSSMIIFDVNYSVISNSFCIWSMFSILFVTFASMFFQLKWWILKFFNTKCWFFDVCLFLKIVVNKLNVFEMLWN